MMGPNIYMGNYEDRSTSNTFTYEMRDLTMACSSEDPVSITSRHEPPRYSTATSIK
ncbi:hypothetical protein EPHNCH_1215 [Anaplasma phagocytophilum str. NCH-1]|uniref:Uncharacterized protein n=2 Tax=Anaplasma phagocytophilum TaxID=948 RepID=A0A0F3N4L5_ANAPH|nr:hypothetical protein YYY_04075 [Anaplasma phagocytophilum str. Dog2]KJV63020.1 hypothetical protein EPHNCH_1215 [Anaplasma phagocytophilum str. NCH-1]